MRLLAQAMGYTEPWLRLDGHNVNWANSDALADIGGQSTFHSNLVQIRPA